MLQDAFAPRSLPPTSQHAASRALAARALVGVVADLSPAEMTAFRRSRPVEFRQFVGLSRRDLKGADTRAREVEDLVALHGRVAREMGVPMVARVADFAAAGHTLVASPVALFVDASASMAVGRGRGILTRGQVDHAAPPVDLAALAASPRAFYVVPFGPAAPSDQAGALRVLSREDMGAAVAGVAFDAEGSYVDGVLAWVAAEDARRRVGARPSWTLVFFTDGNLGRRGAETARARTRELRDEIRRARDALLAAENLGVREVVLVKPAALANWAGASGGDRNYLRKLDAKFKTVSANFQDLANALGAPFTEAAEADYSATCRPAAAFGGPRPLGLWHTVELGGGVAVALHEATSAADWKAAVARDPGIGAAAEAWAAGLRRQPAVLERALTATRKGVVPHPAAVLFRVVADVAGGDSDDSDVQEARRVVVNMSGAVGAAAAYVAAPDDDSDDSDDFLGASGGAVAAASARSGGNGALAALLRRFGF